MTRRNNPFNSEMRIGLSILVFYLFWSLLWFVYSHLIKGSLFDPYLPTPDMRNELQGLFQSGFTLGSDVFGRSLLEVISKGLIYSLSISLVVCFCCAVLGIIVGYITVKGPPLLRSLSDLTTNILFIFPSILIAILVMSVVGQSFWGLTATLIFTGWPAYARISRGETIRVIGLPYVESAKAMGVSEWRLFFKVIVPAILPLIIVHMILGISGVIISEATLGFLGLGGSEYSWGTLLGMSKTVLLESPSMVIVLSITMAGLIVGLNLFGDGLRDYMDPNKES